MNPQQLSRELRQGEGADLTRRRWIIGLSIVGSAMAQAVSLYQTGIIRHLPDPPLPYFDSSRVDASTYAYSRLNSPDGPAMLINYGITAWLAAAGGKDRARQNPTLPLAMGFKILIDSVVALELARAEASLSRVCRAAARPPHDIPKTRTLLAAAGLKATKTTTYVQYIMAPLWESYKL